MDRHQKMDHQINRNLTPNHALTAGSRPGWQSERLARLSLSSPRWAASDTMSFCPHCHARVSIPRLLGRSRRLPYLCPTCGRASQSRLWQEWLLGILFMPTIWSLSLGGYVLAGWAGFVLGLVFAGALGVALVVAFLRLFPVKSNDETHAAERKS